MPKIYISGKITGLERIDYLRKFENAEIWLSEHGFSVINPATVNDRLPDDTTYEEYMKMSMLLLSFCDTIFMLADWKDSPGATKEYQYAVENDLTIMFEEQP